MIRFYHKYDECSKWNLEKHTVFRAQTRGYSYLFFKTVKDLDAMLETLSNTYGIECIDFPDHKAFLKEGLNLELKISLLAVLSFR